MRQLMQWRKLMVADPAIQETEQIMTSRNMARLFPVIASCFVVVALQGCSAVPVQEVKAPESVRPTVPIDIKNKFDEAMVLMKSGDYQKGADVLEGVVTKSQTNPVPLINLAIANAKLGNLEKAENHLKSALAVEADNPVASNELGIIYRKLGRFSEARAVFEGALQKYPNFALVHKNLGILCDIYMRDYECALKGYVAYSGAFPEDKTAKIWIADVEGRLGRK